MDLVTVTDHNRMDASLYLKEKYPDRVFTGVETTAYFLRINARYILLYGMDEKFRRSTENQDRHLSSEGIHNTEQDCPFSCPCDIFH